MVIRLLALLVLWVAPMTLAQDGAVDPAQLPLLPQATHIGSMFYGWGAPPPAQIQERIDDATAVGMNAYTLYLDWPELEPRAGRYDLAELEQTLLWASEHGLSTFANITVIDIEDLVMPREYLTEGDNGFPVLAEGVRFNDPALLARFAGLLDAVVPMMVEHGVFYLGVGNEVDGWLQANPDQLADYLDFIAAAKAHVQRIEPRLAVGLTVTGGVPLEQPDLLARFYTVADVVSANIYGIDVSDFTLTSEAETRALIGDFLAAFGERPLVIPEIGCNSAESMNSSDQLQAECFETVMNILAQQDNLRFATVFTFHDFSPMTCGLVQAAFGFMPGAGYDNIYDQRVADYLCTLGLVEADGTPKPAFAPFLDGVQALTNR